MSEPSNCTTAGPCTAHGGGTTVICTPVVWEVDARSTALDALRSALARERAARKKAEARAAALETAFRRLLAIYESDAAPDPEVAPRPDWIVAALSDPASALATHDTELLAKFAGTVPCGCRCDEGESCTHAANGIAGRVTLAAHDAAVRAAERQRCLDAVACVRAAFDCEAMATYAEQCAELIESGEAVTPQTRPNGFGRGGDCALSAARDIVKTTADKGAALAQLQSLDEEPRESVRAQGRAEALREAADVCAEEAREAARRAAAHEDGTDFLDVRALHTAASHALRQTESRLRALADKPDAIAAPAGKGAGG